MWKPSMSSLMIWRPEADTCKLILNLFFKYVKMLLEATIQRWQSKDTERLVP